MLELGTRHHRALTRPLGIDARQLGLRSRKDWSIVRRAINDGYVLVTNNTTDFISLLQREKVHWGCNYRSNGGFPHEWTGRSRNQSGAAGRDRTFQLGRDAQEEESPTPALCRAGARSRRSPIACRERRV
jgi:Domain of unknown function (DUF5615)